MSEKVSAVAAGPTRWVPNAEPTGAPLQALPLEGEMVGEEMAGVKFTVSVSPLAPMGVHQWAGPKSVSGVMVDEPEVDVVSAGELGFVGNGTV
jgi:hypothetical protein